MSKELIKRIISSIILLPLSFYFIIQGSFVLIFFTVVCFIVSSYEWNMMTKNRSYKIYGFIFLIITFYTFYSLSIDVFGVFFVILICASTDIGGYLFGKLFKGPKLTKISPNKTYAGMIGGYFLSLITLTVITNIIDYPGTPIQFFLITILISTVSQIGDIIVSYFKRLSKIKNTGKLIPGHGGLLDRIDGMIFAFPIYYLVDLTGYLSL
ncbi:phosphatidate cytidylyltransferase [Candidatus Pelagibacter sp.]|jgi:phosphatidate cytidylyltransferase|nr:phosphatidate cytidylyltransferase [Candidatus Pelagibacter sp.]